MVVWARRSDRLRERVAHLIVPCILGFIGFAAASQAHSLPVQLLCLCVATMGVYGALPIFWTLPTAFLTGAAAAAGIALINSLGNLSGYLGPQIVNWLTQGSGNFGPALLALGISMLVPAAVAAILRGQQHDQAIAGADSTGKVLR
jgi:MFS transporter, ACS family, tartrate transporter